MPSHREARRGDELEGYVVRLAGRSYMDSSGAEAQQHVFHLHFHVVPRHKGDGQDIHWSTHPELRGRFDELLARLR